MLFGMEIICIFVEVAICLGRNMLASAKASSHSWFLEIQKISLKYLLPHPINFLNNPPTKQSFKRLVKSAVLDF